MNERAPQEFSEITRRLAGQVLSTAKIINELYRAANNVPQTITNKEIKIPIEENCKAARAKLLLEKIENTSSTKLSVSSENITIGVNELKNNRNTRSWAEDFANQLDVLQKQLSQLTVAQQSLLKQFIQVITQQQQQIKELFTQHNSGNLSKESLQKKLPSLLKMQDQLILDVFRLHTDQEALQEKFVSLEALADKTVKTTRGEMPAGPQQAPRET